MVGVDGIVGETGAGEIPGLAHKVAPHGLPAEAPASEIYDGFPDNQGLDQEAQYSSPDEEREIAAILASGDNLADLTHIGIEPQRSVGDPFPEVEYTSL